MKKIFSSIMMVAAVLFAASCTSEDLTRNESGENVKVSFSLGLEGISTRAISDGSGANKLVYAVFDEAGKRISGIEAVNMEVTFPATVELTLVKDKKYKVAFWAQNKACSAYSVDKEAMTVTVDYASIKENNDEKRDAFFKTVDVTVKGSTSIDVELKRALAQINVGVTAEDWEAAKKAGATIATSESFIKKAASSLNVLTGATANLVAGNIEINTIILEGGLKADATDYKMPILYTNGATIDVDHLYLNLAINHNTYYPFAVPFPVSVSDIDYANPTLAAASEYGTHYLIKRYNGAKRAEYGVNKDENWVVVEIGETLQPGEGYIISALTGKDAKPVAIRIPLTYAPEYNVSHSIIAHTGTAAANDPIQKGWNFIAHPYLSKYAKNMTL